MKLLFCCITKNTKVTDYVISKQAEILRDEYKKTKGITFDSLKIETNKHFIDYIEQKIKHEFPDGIIVIAEKGLSLTIKNSEIFQSIFFGEFEEKFSYGKINIHDTITTTSTRIIKNFLNFFDLMDNMGIRTATTLPIKNFSASEINWLIGIFKENTADRDFIQKFTVIVNQLNKRKKPARKRHDKSRFIDDKCYRFEVSPDDHSQVEYAPPHGITCQINGKFRFR